MSDTVEDLQAAEDHIGFVAAAAARFIEAVNVAYTGAVVPTALMAEVFAARLALTAAIEPWCRPSCEDGDCDEDCDCQAHGDRPHHDNEGSD